MIQRVCRLLDADAEVFALLHALDVRLEASNQFVNELVPRNILRRIRLELLTFIIVARLCVLVKDARLGPDVLDPLHDKFVLAIVFKQRLCIRRAEASTTDLMNALKVARVFQEHQRALTVNLTFCIIPDAHYR